MSFTFRYDGSRRELVLGGLLDRAQAVELLGELGVEDAGERLGPEFSTQVERALRDLQHDGADSAEQRAFLAHVAEDGLEAGFTPEDVEAARRLLA